MSAAFVAAIAEGSVRVAELYTITLASGVIHRFTSHSKDITWDAAGNVYSAIPLTRDPIAFNTDFAADTFQLSLGVISGPFYDVIQNNLLDGATVELKRVLWDSSYSSDNEMLLFEGHMNIEYDRMICVAEVASLYDVLNIVVPTHTFGTPCVHSVFDDNCTVNQEDYESTGTATAGSRNSLTDSARAPIFTVPFTCVEGAPQLEVNDTLYVLS
jgi:hypothetical protein